MRGFVERVGDRTPLVASDGTKYLGDALTVEALEVMARSVGYGTPITIAVPAYSVGGAVRGVARRVLRPAPASNGVAPTVDLRRHRRVRGAAVLNQGFPPPASSRVCDFGASGTTVTLIDAGAGSAQVGPSVRYTDLSGDAIDQLILNRVRESTPNTDTTGGLASTTRMGSLTRQLDQCRHTKEQLSTATVATISIGAGEDFELSRERIRRTHLFDRGPIPHHGRRDTATQPRFPLRTWPRWPPSVAARAFRCSALAFRRALGATIHSARHTPLSALPSARRCLVNCSRRWVRRKVPSWRTLRNWRLRLHPT